MWEMMWSWWWIRPLPNNNISSTSSKNHFIRESPIISKENNHVTTLQRILPSPSSWKWKKRKKSSNSKQKFKRVISPVLMPDSLPYQNQADEVKFLYESKSGKTTRRNSMNFDFHQHLQTTAQWDILPIM